MCLRKQELEIQLEDPPEQVRIGETPPTPLEPTESPKHKQEFSSHSAQKETGAPGMCSGVCSTQLDEALTMSIWRGVLWSGNPPPTFCCRPYSYQNSLTHRPQDNPGSPEKAHILYSDPSISYHLEQGPWTGVRGCRDASGCPRRRPTWASSL